MYTDVVLQHYDCYMHCSVVNTICTSRNCSACSKISRLWSDIIFWNCMKF